MFQGAKKSKKVEAEENKVSVGKVSFYEKQNRFGFKLGGREVSVSYLKFMTLSRILEEKFLSQSCLNVWLVSLLYFFLLPSQLRADWWCQPEHREAPRSHCPLLSFCFRKLESYSPKRS